MMIITIAINEDTIEEHKAINLAQRNWKGETCYLVDEKFEIWHKRSDGARKLVIKILEKIENEKAKRSKKV